MSKKRGQYTVPCTNGFAHEWSSTGLVCNRCYLGRSQAGTVPTIRQRIEQATTNHRLRFLVDRDGPICHYCRRVEGNTIDHKQPKSKNGSNHHSNLVLACVKCNQEKADMIYQHYLLWMRLRNEQPGLNRAKFLHIYVSDPERSGVILENDTPA